MKGLSIMAASSPAIRFSPDEKSGAAAAVRFTNNVLALANSCYEILFLLF